MMTDPIADMLTRIRNASMAQHKTVSMPSSKMKVEIARILKVEGFIRGFDLRDNDKPQPTLRLHLKYDENNNPVIAGLQRVSKPGRRIYFGRKDIPWVNSGLGIAIVSTSGGLMTGRDARRSGVGGEIICYVW